MTAILLLLPLCASLDSYAQTVPSNGVYVPATNTLGFSTNTTLQMVINSTGAVGIGTASPGYALQVAGDIIASKSIAFNAVSSIPSNAGFYAPTTNAIGFVTNGAEAMRIISTGNVGIGTTAPSAQLQVINATAGGTAITGTDSGSPGPSGTGVYGSAATTTYGYGVYGIETGSTNTGFGVYGTNASTSTGVGVYGSETGSSNTGYAIQAVNNSTSGWGVYASGTSPNYLAGSVGIGTTTLQSGYILTTNGSIYVNGYVTMTSDRRLKKSIQPIESESALDDISALRPVTFTWKKTNKPDMGLIAQDVQAVFPELVNRGNDGCERRLNNPQKCRLKIPQVR